MSRLETSARPLLLPLIRGDDRTLDISEQAVVATWFTKTVLVAGSKFKPALPSAFYEQLRADGRPSDLTRVWLAGTPYLGRHQSDFRPIRTRTPDAPMPPLPNTFSGLLALGNLAGFVVSWLDAEPPFEDLERFSPALVRIWPANEPTAAWPPAGGRLNVDGLEALADAIANPSVSDTGS